jgi:uncharacterized protein (DUF1778 family)
MNSQANLDTKIDLPSRQDMRKLIKLSITPQEYELIAKAAHMSVETIDEWIRKTLLEKAKQ